MDFLSDYWTYHRCYEIPRSYALWTGIGVLGSIIHRRVVFYHGDIEIHANMYVGLIGAQGNSKSTSCTFGRGFFQKACPESHIGPSRATPESLCTNMTKNDFPRTFTNWDGETVEVRPYAFFVNEFKNFVGRSPFDMITFLTDIYDTKIYPASTIARGLENVINPAINMIMCETPEWFIRNIKGDVISGGIMRRFILVYELEEAAPIPIIHISPDAALAKERVEKRLAEIHGTTGKFAWGDAISVYEKWYMGCYERRKKEANPTMRGYLKSKHIQIFKVMMLLDSVSDKPMRLFTKELFDEALALLNMVETNMPKLSLAAGRNELVGPQQKIIETLEQNNGWLPEKQLLRLIEVDLNPNESYNVLRHMVNTEQVFKKTYRWDGPTAGSKVDRVMVILPWKHAELQKQKEAGSTSQGGSADSTP